MDPFQREKILKFVGLGLWIVGILFGLLVAFYAYVISPLGTKNPLAYFEGEVIGFFFAFIPAVLVYIWVPRIIDRFEPEPWWALTMAFLWGAVGALGIAYVINTGMSMLGGVLGEAAFGGKSGAALGSTILGASISAPIIEEAAKGAMVLGMFWFLKREFDGPVDGVIYGMFAGLGFAMTENMLYYSRAIAGAGAGAFAFQFALRGVLKPWGHPFYTSITGLGVGIARETTRTWLKYVAPIGCYIIAVLFHSGWNTSGLVGQIFGVPQLVSIVLMLLLYGAIMLCFLGLVIGLVVREARILRKNLHDEVLLGNITPGELALVCSPVGRIKARFRKGGLGVEFLVAVAKLGMFKWHLARATAGKKMTISGAEIVPLRQKILELKRRMGPGLAN